jgi:hypothetical protein
MVKLTVIYTLPEGADHKAFLKWRTTEHQKENMEIPGVIKSDFYAIREIYSHKSRSTENEQDPKSEDRLNQEPLPLSYRYITEAYWPNMKSFKSAFFDSGYQERLMDSLKKIANPIFLVSEEVLSEVS